MAGRVTGVDDTIKNINLKIKTIPNATARGLKRAALLVKRDSSRRTPVEFGNLKGGLFTESVKVGGKIGEIIGYAGVDYAIYVHESPFAGKTVGEPKFLENALRQNTRRIIEIIADDAKKGL
jgi:hypothetical protein